MITTDSNFDTAKDNPHSQGVILAKMETSWKQARLSSSGDFSSPIANTADITTKPGSIIAGSSNADILSATGYGTPTNNSFFDDKLYGVRILVKETITLINFKFDSKTSSGSETVTVSLNKVSSEEGGLIGEIILAKPEFSELYSTTYVEDTTFTTTTITPVDSSGNSIVLKPGIYLILLSHNDASNSLDCKTWKPNTAIWPNVDGINYYGFSDGVFEIGRTVIQKSTGIYLGFGSSGSNPTLDGEIFLKELTVKKYVTSSYDSGWKPVKNQAGANSAPSGNPVFYMEVSTRGLNTITGRARGADDGSGTNPSSQFTSLADGATISATKAYYSLGVDITIGSNYADSPEVLALVAYEGTEEGFVRHETDLFGYDPIVASESTIETTIDPLKATGSISEPQITLRSDKVGKDKTTSYAESIVQNNYFINSLLTLEMGFASIAEGSFVEYQKGLIKDYEYNDDGNSITFFAGNPLLRSKDPLGLDSISISHGFTIDRATPTNAILQLMKLTAPPLRLISDASFTTLEASGHWMDGWEVFRPFKESVKDVKALINELCEIAGISVVVQEDGLVYPIVLGPNGYNHSNPALGATGGIWSGRILAEFDDDNSVENGKCNLQLSDRINNCRVHRGWWNEISLEESKDKTSDEEWNETSALNYGVGPKKIIESKWIPISTQLNSEYLSAIVAQRLVHLFGYGVWIMKRRSGHEFIHLQVGDCVTVEGKQILFKGFGETEKVRAQIIAKKLNKDFTIDWTFWIYENVNAIVSPEPTNQSTNLTFPGETTSSIDLAWTAASPAVTGNLLVYKAGSAPTYVPEQGRIYKNGEEPETGNFVKFAGLSSTTVTGLASGTTYHFALYAYNAVAGIESGFGSVFRPITYKQDNPLTGSHATS